MDIVVEIIRSRKSFLLGERKLADTVYLTKDDLDELNRIMEKRMQASKLVPLDPTWNHIFFGDRIFGMEIQETECNVKSRCVVKLID